MLLLQFVAACRPFPRGSKQTHVVGEGKGEGKVSLSTPWKHMGGWG